LARATAGTSVAIALGVLIAALIEGWNDPRPFDAAWSRLANRVLLVEVAGLLALAVGLGVWPAWTRARERWARSPDLNATARMRILVDELAPFDAARRQAAVEAERTQLAAALHATVLPPLRTALAAFQAGSREAAERGLGEAVDEVEQLMASREPVIVDALGLLAGLEWLAERIQVRSGIPVEIDVATTSERPPNSVERAAFRVAQLALDNAGRHSAASTIRIAGSVARDVVGLTVNDDGVGFVAGSMPHGRGLRDMDAAAERVRARVSVGPLGPVGASERRGTAVGFDWPAR